MFVCISKFKIIDLFVFLNICNYVGDENDNPPSPPQRNLSLFAKTMSDPNMLDHHDDSDENGFELVGLEEDHSFM